MGLKWLHTAFIVLGFSTLTARSGDLDIDVNGARASYNSQKILADSAKSEYDTAYSRFQPYLSALAAAQSRFNDADRRLKNSQSALAAINSQLNDVDQKIKNLENENQNLRQRAVDIRHEISKYQTEVDRYERQIADLERDIQELRQRIRNEERQGDWECVYVDHGHEEHRNGHRAIDSSRSEADVQAKAACLAVHGACDLSSCQRTSSDLDQLRRELSNAESSKTSVENQLANSNSRLRDSQYQLDRNTTDQQDNMREISSAERTRSDLSSRRSDAQREAGNAQSDLSESRSNMQRAEADVSRERPSVDRAKIEMDRQQAEAQKRYAYLQQVIANYEAEKQNSIRIGSDSGSVHGAKEADDRANGIGNESGSQDGALKGRMKGAADGGERSYVRGYVAGRRDGSAETSLIQRYQSGLMFGSSEALRKATLEKLPEGYNDTFKSTLARAPVNIASVDISEQIPQDPGSNGRDLRTLRLDVVNVTGPVYKFPAEPLRNVPQADPQNPIVPARDNRYRQPPCDGLRNAEFVALCLQSYDSSYSANFTLSYRTYYSSAYRTSFAVAAAATYDEAFSQDVPAESARGRGIGAEHMGALKGFSDRLAQASAEQYARGAELLTKDLESGHLVIPRSVLLEEASGDGVLQPGESMKLTLVIDNLGKLSSPLEGVSVKVTNSSNAKSITVPLRSLPALAPETRTTLKGVISATSSAMFAGDDVRLEGAIQILKDDGSSEEIFSFTATKATHFPVELISIETSAPLAVNKWTSVPFKFQNLSSKPTAEQKVRASTKPKNVEVDNKNGFIVPALNVGESTIITLPVMPSVWAGGTPVVFSAETIDATGAVLVEQRLKKNLEISRSGKLNLLTAAGQPSDGTPIVVAAGSMVKFNVQFQFLSTTERGPFVFRYAQSSDSEIKPWNSTTRIDYGMVWPGRNPKPEPFSFQIPASLKGKTAWIALALDEGGVPIHMLQVWLDVR